MDYNFSCNIHGNGNTVSQCVTTTSTDDSPLRCTRVCGYWGVPDSFCWMGKTYEINFMFNKYLQQIKQAWDSHCFTVFLETLKAFDDNMMKAYKKVGYNAPKDAKDPKPITLFIGRLLENFEGTYTTVVTPTTPHPVFIDYLVNPDGKKSTSYIVGYDTTHLQKEDLFRSGIIKIEDGDLHEVLKSLEDWYEHFHNSMLALDKYTYKAIKVTNLKATSFIIKELFDKSFGKTRKEAKAIQKTHYSKNGVKVIQKVKGNNNVTQVSRVIHTTY